MESIALTVDNWIRLERNNARSVGLSTTDLRDAFSYDNPDFYKKKRLGFWTGDTPRKLTLVQDDNGEICLPRGGWSRLTRFLDRLGVAPQCVDATVAVPLDRPLSYKAPFDLGPDQRTAARMCVVKRQGIVVGPCASGKTEIALKAIADTGQRTLVLVHTERILKNWVATANERFGKRAAGAVYGKAKQFDRPITVGMLQTIRNVLRRDPDFANRFGCVVLDEAHHAPATTFSEVVNAFPARWRLAFTATPRRKDGKEVLFYDAFGSELQTNNRGREVPGPRVLFEINDADLDRYGRIVPVDVVVVPTEYRFDLNREGELADAGWLPEPGESSTASARRWAQQAGFAGSLRTYADMLDDMSRNNQRQARILEYLLPEVRADHACLLLADRREFCLQVQAWLQRRKVQSGRLMGTKYAKEQDRTEAALREGRLRVAVGTSIADEGMNIPVLSRGFGCTPAAGNPGRFVQQLGRLKRKHPDKMDAVYYYFWDRRVSALSWHAGAVLRAVKAPHRVWYSECPGQRVPLTHELLRTLEEQQ